MSADSSGLADDVAADLNADRGPDYGPQPDPVPDRPADGASTEAWVDYVVALGADRTFVTQDTEHHDGSDYVVAPALKRKDLIALADRLGG